MLVALFALTQIFLSLPAGRFADRRGLTAIWPVYAVLCLTALLCGGAVGAAIVRLLIPVFARKMSEWVLITGATAVAGLMFLLYPFTRSAATMGLCSILIGMALGLGSHLGVGLRSLAEDSEKL